MSTRRDEIKSTYTNITGIVSPYSNYLQPDDGVRMLLPYEWVLALVATAMGMYLGSFLKELGKIQAQQFAEFLSKLRSAEKPDEQEETIIEFYCEHVEEVTLLSDESSNRLPGASATAQSEVIGYLRSKNFPDDTATQVGTEIADELQALLRPQSDQNG